MTDNQRYKKSGRGHLCFFTALSMFKKCIVDLSNSLHLNWNYIFSMESNFSHTQIYSQRHTLIHTSVSGPFKQQKIKMVPVKKKIPKQRLMKGSCMFCFPSECSRPEGSECARVLGRQHKGKERWDERREKGRKKKDLSI